MVFTIPPLPSQPSEAICLVTRSQSHPFRSYPDSLAVDKTLTSGEAERDNVGQILAVVGSVWVSVKPNSHAVHTGRSSTPRKRSKATPKSAFFGQNPTLSRGHANCRMLLFCMQGTPRRRTRSALTPLLEIERGNGPLLATCIHAAHAIRDSLHPHLELTDAERLREEDPFTGLWATVCPNRVVARRSRFEVDLNRAPTQALYKKPEDAWGLRVWRTPLSDAAVAKTMSEYRAYYSAVQEVLEDLEREYGRFVVLD